jgi:hypothetical protein
MKTNCLFFGLALYWRLRRKGKEVYFALRRSRWGSFPHILILTRRKNGLLRVVSFKPTSAKEQKCPPILFEGAPRWGDSPDHPNGQKQTTHPEACYRPQDAASWRNW